MGHFDQVGFTDTINTEKGRPIILERFTALEMKILTNTS